LELPVLERVVRWARARSPWILHLNTGGCNGCDIEVVAALTPRYDVERFGILLRGSPRHADIIVVTGPITVQMRERVKRIYDQTPEPKFVVAVGQCACSGGVFRNCYSVIGGVDKVMPVDIYIPGCPPKPEAIIYGIAQLIDRIAGGGIAWIYRSK
jgi:NADH-quinone oxidoreductase B subunit